MNKKTKQPLLPIQVIGGDVQKIEAAERELREIYAANSLIYPENDTLFLGRVKDELGELWITPICIKNVTN